MNKAFLLILIAALSSIFTSTAFSEGTVSETGKTGMSFLAISPSSRVTSLGGTASALYTGASSMWSNPSLIALRKERSVQVTHTEWIEGINQEFAAVSSDVSFGSLGFAVQLLDSGDIELRGDAPSKEPLGAYSIKNVAFSFTYARTITDRIAAGLTYKKLFEKISDETAGGYAFDGGIVVRTPIESISMSAAARNYGRMGKLKSERTKLPSDVSFGFLYSGIIPGFDQSFCALTDVVIPKYGDTGVRLGFEVDPIEHLSLRIGYRSDSDIEDVSLGIGFLMERFSADMSYTPMEEGFDDSLRLTLSLMGF